MQELNNMLHIFLLSLHVHHNNAFLTTTNRVCQHDNKTFQECDVMFYTNWSVCDGKNCPSGQLTRDKGICCIQDNIVTNYTLKEWCIQRCNLTKEDFREIVSSNVSTGIGAEASDTIQGSDRICIYKTITFHECDVMFYTNWTICDGIKCPIGHQTRGKGICCISYNNETGQALKNRCMQNCNFTDEDFQETVPRNVTIEIQNETSEINLKGVSIAGAVIGVLAIFGLLGLLIFFLCRCWKKEKENRKVETEESEEKEKVG